MIVDLENLLDLLYINSEKMTKEEDPLIRYVMVA